jgi:hypothetical protein
LSKSLLFPLPRNTQEITLILTNTWHLFLILPIAMWLHVPTRKAISDPLNFKNFHTTKLKAWTCSLEKSLALCWKFLGCPIFFLHKSRFASHTFENSCMAQRWSLTVLAKLDYLLHVAWFRPGSTSQIKKRRLSNNFS